MLFLAGRRSSLLHRRLGLDRFSLPVAMLLSRRKISMTSKPIDLIRSVPESSLAVQRHHTQSFVPSKLPGLLSAPHLGY